MSDDTNIPIDPDMTPDADPTGAPTSPAEDPTVPDVPIDVPKRPRHSLGDTQIGGTLGDARNQ